MEQKPDEIFMIFLPGLIMFFAALLVRYASSKYPSMWSGYRTPMSTKNEDTWNEGNAYSSKVAFYIGFIDMIVLSAIAGLNKGSKGWIMVKMKTEMQPIFAFFLFGSVIVLILLTELHLKKTFDADGKRRAT